MSTPIKSSNVSSTNSLTTATYSPSSYSTNSTTLTNYEEKAVSIFNGLVSKCCDGLGLISSIEEITTERIGKIYECIYFGELLEDYILHPKHDLEKVSNIELIISKISLDLGVNLNYIDAASVVAKEPIPVHNLVEILDGLYDFRADRDSDLSESESYEGSLDTQELEFQKLREENLKAIHELTLEIQESNQQKDLDLEDAIDLQISRSQAIAEYNMPLPKKSLTELDIIWEKGETGNTPTTKASDENLPPTISEKESEVDEIETETIPEMTNLASELNRVETLKSPKQSDSSTLFKQIKSQINAQNKILGFENSGTYDEVPSLSFKHDRQKSVPESAEEVKLNPVNPSIKELRLDILNSNSGIQTVENTNEVKKYLFGSDTASSKSCASPLITSYSPRNLVPMPSAGYKNKSGPSEVKSLSLSEIQNDANNSAELNSLMETVYRNIRSERKKSGDSSKSKKPRQFVAVKPKTSENPQY